MRSGGAAGALIDEYIGTEPGSDCCCCCGGGGGMFSFCGTASGSSCAAKLAAESTEDTEEDGLVGDHIPVDVLPVVWELEDHCEEDVDMGVGLGAPSSARLDPA